MAKNQRDVIKFVVLNFPETELMIVVDRLSPARTLDSATWRPTTRWTFCSGKCLESTILHRCMQSFPDDYRISYAPPPTGEPMCYCADANV
jgi:hypothetical protein